jgi:hypothetical protein
MKTLQQALEEKILVADAKTVLDITDYWLQDLRRQVQPQYREGIDAVWHYIRSKPMFLRDNAIENCDIEKQKVKP